MGWRVALSLDQLLDEVNARAPRRSTISDGSIGDAAHSSRTSDHNPNSRGVVQARDITDDPRGGHDATAFAEYLRSTRDPRIKYVIDQGRMFSSYSTSSRAAWQWGPYTGVNAHKQHTHVSVNDNPSLYDSTKSWGWADANAATEVSMFVNKGDKGTAVRYWQRRLNRCVPQDDRITPDGDYGPATDKLVKAVTGRDGGKIGPIEGDKIEQAVLVRALKRASINQAQPLDISELAEEVAGELTITVGGKR